jgi:hypothetical protein
MLDGGVSSRPECELGGASARAKSGEIARHTCAPIFESSSKTGGSEDWPAGRAGRAGLAGRTSRTGKTDGQDSKTDGQDSKTVKDGDQSIA